MQRELLGDGGMKKRKRKRKKQLFEFLILSQNEKEE